MGSQASVSLNGFTGCMWVSQILFMSFVISGSSERHPHRGHLCLCASSLYSPLFPATAPLVFFPSQNMSRLVHCNRGTVTVWLNENCWSQQVVFVFALYVCACMCVRVRACVHACLRTHACVLRSSHGLGCCYCITQWQFRLTTFVLSGFEICPS